MKSFLFPLCISMLFLTTSCVKESITPSGRLETREYPFADFSAIDISSAIMVKLIPSSSDTEYVNIEADDNLFPFLNVEQRGPCIEVSLDQFLNIRDIRGKRHITVTIVYKNLSALSLSGASQGEILPNSDTLTSMVIMLSGASKLKGRLQAKRMDVSLSGASKLEGSLFAERVNVLLSGASEWKGELNANQA